MPNTEQSIQETGGIPQISMTLQVSGMTQTPVDTTLSISGMAADAKSTGDAIANVQEAIADLDEEIQHITGMSYPVGAIFMTTSDSAPDFEGTWVEIGITATWTQLKTGKRGYTELEEGDTGGAVHFWMRTE